MNLTAFALFSTRIPSAFLGPVKKKNHHIKNLFSLFCDCTLTLFMTMMITTFFQVYGGIYLSTVSSKFTISFPVMMNFITYPLVTFAYFTICMMANDGMTLGTHATKQRLIVHTELKQALLLTLNALTLNLCYFKIKDLFRPMDYRYQEMMEEKFENISLLTFIKEEEPQTLQEEFEIAA